MKQTTIHKTESFSRKPVHSKHNGLLPIRMLFVLCAVFLCIESVGQAEEPKRPIPFIFDTDIGNDVDDVLALGVIHALQNRGECELKAVTITKDHPEAAAFVDAVNTFYGRGNIPVGVCRSGVTTAKGKFIGLAEVKDGDQYRYPHDLISGENALDAVTVLRKALVNEADGSVVIAQVGFSTNLANLLNSKADAISPLNGVELVRKKVKLFSIMAGAFEKIPRNGKMIIHREYNVVKDIPSAQILAEKSPVPIIWSGYEIGITVAYPHESIEQDYQYVAHHPLAEAYVLYSPPPHNRPTWDLTSVLFGVRPARGYFDLSSNGTVAVEQDGLTTFQSDEKGLHRYLILNDLQRSRVTEALVLLSSEPPQK